MPLRILPLALCCLLLAACSTVPSNAPARIDPPPVDLMTRCSDPGKFSGENAQDLAEWAVRWIGTAGCERSKRQALVEAWPR